MSVENLNPPLDKDLINSNGTTIVIKGAQLKNDIQTQMGKINQALTIDCSIKGNNDLYSYLFSLDKDVITGSVGRIISKTGVKHIKELDTKALAKLKGLEVLVKNKAGKLYWY